MALQDHVPRACIREAGFYFCVCRCATSTLALLDVEKAVLPVERSRASPSARTGSVPPNRKTVYHLFGIPGRKLDRLLAEGVVRTVKLGQAKSGARLYRVEDVDRALLAIAAGRKPARPRYQATRTAERRK